MSRLLVEHRGGSDIQLELCAKGIEPPDTKEEMIGTMVLWKRLRVPTVFFRRIP